MYDRSVLELLQQESVISGVDHPTNDEEILKAVNSLKNNAPGESGLTSHMFKAVLSTNQIYELLKGIILVFWKNKLPPDQWEISPNKIVAKIVHSRLQPIAEKLDYHSKQGFRPGRDCTDAVFTAKLPLVKAFDRVPPDLLRNVLESFLVSHQKLLAS